ncbi:hypothetical protein GCM10009555_080960 [Acrocarpospora macrocephala]|uniref:Uncharacterized protein n=1 Tax=Acrocarpospora macrocephala TaxID=150177 RepID=A0A5M3X4X3_9ACTN|nr:hypothetical protein [Acrocarpospora macrocephala]GES15672.1 hypothetical protein Amac_092700 [Acrocarpospora macrocephala]
MTKYRYAVLGLLLAGGYCALKGAILARYYFTWHETATWTLDVDPLDSALVTFIWATGASLLIAWALWQVARGPARTVPKLATPLRSGGNDGLRRALYWLAGIQLAFIIMDDTPLSITGILEIIVAAIVVILFHRVLTRTSAMLRWTATIFGAIGIVGKVTSFSIFFGSLAPVELAMIQVAVYLGPAIWLIMILIAQHRDGRWTWTALWPGWLSLIAANLLTLILIGPDVLYREVIASGLALQLLAVLSDTNVFAPLWAVRSAHQLADGEATGAEPYQDGPEEGVVADGNDAGGLGFEGGDAAIDKERLGDGAPVVRGAGEE